MSPEPTDTPEEQPTRPPRPTFRATPLVPTEQPAPTSTTSTTGGPTPPLDPALRAAVESAKADLAGRQSVPIDSIGVVEVRSVVWPDGALGCPKPGMAYPQVQVEGLLIRLSIGDRIFEYHSGGGKPPFLCEQKP